MVLSSAETSRQKGPSRCNPRLLAARILQEVLLGRSLVDALHRHLGRCQAPRDRSLVQEFCYGVMRWLLSLDGLLQQLLNKPLKPKDQDVYALLLLGLYQLHYLRVADHAAVYQTAGVADKLGKHWAVGLINGVLREFQRRQDELVLHLRQDSTAHYAMPAWLLTRLQQIWPQDWRERATALNARPPMCLRVNRLRISREGYLARLRAAGIGACEIAHTRSGVILEHPMDVQALPGFTEGMVSVQDGGAQLAAELLRLQAGQRVLDACAAPGGKTGHILETVQPLRVTALDLDKSRLERVRENLSRLSLDAEILVGDAARPVGQWAKIRYDRILVDVPCSATGVIRRHPDIKHLRRAEDIVPLVERQAEILNQCWSLLRPGGLLLYTTCSILPEENEQQVANFLNQQADARQQSIKAQWGMPCLHGRLIAPGMHNMDGFYYACLEKQDA